MDQRFPKRREGCEHENNNKLEDYVTAEPLAESPWVSDVFEGEGFG